MGIWEHHTTLIRVFNLIIFIMCKHYLRIFDTKEKFGHLVERLQIGEIVFLRVPEVNKIG